ncbi:LysR family transcriptional regulator [Bordetella trematum]|uniref:LysR family transcriptional regulator n=1 Tax=Bordetella trematum TaxID=123899 RepID=A0A157RC68_9BORD|nr:LysR family transcriptional regulator [Bordetella trematum]AUL45859.1 LysR family transcriptional regulator [Bordetella trematum]AZR92644.1 LysR family transcriptional regulator [Bordetella trematum]NNH19645.1 LysR family transcriptional regulator [Bordetella trematum]QIM71241.1 LysR family transcriptional regulator [Bordetella trematum]SAI54889.1 LysR family transcriptional regulator [Bordetella trematum]
MLAGLNAKRLQYFFEAVTAGSVRGAAERLGVEPSIVSRQIQLLEKELGVTLLERKGRGIVPTDIAAIVMEHCRDRQASEQALRARLDEVNGLQRGDIQIVTSEGFVDLLMSGVVDAFCREHPGVRVSLRTAGASEAVRAVVHDDAHIGVVFGAAAAPALRIVETRNHPLCVIAWPDHPLARQRKRPSLKEVARYPLALMEPGFGLRQLIETAALSENLVFEPAFVANSVLTLKRYVESRLGLTFTSANSVVKEVARGELVALRSTNPIFEAAQTRLMVRVNRPLTAAVRSMLERIQASPLFGV